MPKKYQAGRSFTYCSLILPCALFLMADFGFSASPSEAQGELEGILDSISKGNATEIEIENALKRLHAALVNNQKEDYWRKVVRYSQNRKDSSKALVNAVVQFTARGVASISNDSSFLGFLVEVGNKDTRLVCIKQFGRFRKIKAIKAILLQLVLEGDPDIAMEAVKTLRENETQLDSNEFETFFQIFRNEDTSESLRNEILRLLERHVKSFPKIMVSFCCQEYAGWNALSKESCLLLHSIMRSIGKEATRYLNDYLENTSPERHYAALIFVCKGGAERAKYCEVNILRSLKSQNRMVVQAGLNAIGLIAEPREDSKLAVHDLTKVPDSVVRSLALSVEEEWNAGVSKDK